MPRVNVYVPDALKVRLAQTAARTGKREAELIREGIEAVVSVGMAESPNAAVLSNLPALDFDTDDIVAVLDQGRQGR